MPIEPRVDQVQVEVEYHPDARQVIVTQLQTEVEYHPNLRQVNVAQFIVMVEYTPPSTGRKYGPAAAQM